MALEDMATQVEEEIRECREQHGENWRTTYFNNFHHYLPDDSFSLEGNLGIQPSYAGKRAQAIGRLDKTYEETEQAAQRSKVRRYSTLKLKQTRREFLVTIDRVFHETGVSIDAIKALQRQRTSSCESLKQIEAQLYDLVFPAYLRLREMGYNHYPDLIE
ncbi:MAG: hypothetical protein AABX70_02580 [Nanoarchaeota archaeon]